MPRHGVKVDSSLLECPFCVRKEKKMDAQGTEDGAEATADHDAEGAGDAGGGAPGAQRQKRRMKKKRQENKIGLW